MTANQVQIRRDSSTNLNAATPASGELGYDTTNKELRLGDGATAGGIRVPNSTALQNQSFIAALAGGTADALTLTVSPVPAAYATYQRFVFKAASDNTTSATINVNSLGVKTIKKRTTSGVADLTGGEIQQDGIYAIVYDGTYFQLEDFAQGEISTDYELLATATASASATLDFESVITSTYDSYVFVISNIRPATDGSQLVMRTSTNNGSTYDSTAANYISVYEYKILDGSAVVSSSNIGNLSSTYLNIAGGSSATIGSAAAEGVSGTVTLLSPSGTTRTKTIMASGIYQGITGTEYSFEVFGYRNATTDIDAVRFLMDSGNITSGSIRLYGRRAS